MSISLRQREQLRRVCLLRDQTQDETGRCVRGIVTAVTISAALWVLVSALLWCLL